VAQLYPQALGSLFIASFDSQGYGGRLPSFHCTLSILYVTTGINTIAPNSSSTCIVANAFISVFSKLLRMNDWEGGKHTDFKVISFGCFCFAKYGKQVKNKAFKNLNPNHTEFPPTNVYKHNVHTRRRKGKSQI
jgi:hypothetical protein